MYVGKAFIMKTLHLYIRRRNVMIRLIGFLKVLVVFLMDFSIIFCLFDSVFPAIVIIGGMALYVWLGGYLTLAREGAVRADKLPDCEKNLLNAAGIQLAEDVKRHSSADITGLKLYLIPGNEELQASSYGACCISVTRGMINSADPVTLNAVLAHEVSHALNFDAEFNRAVFCSVTLLLGTISVISAAVLIILFLIFLLLSGFRSWPGIVIFRKAKEVSGGSFRLIQRMIVGFYRFLLGLASRHAEYRSDMYSCRLGYGIQLAHFLSVADAGSHQRLTWSDALYRSHPPIEKRIARLEKYRESENKLKTGEQKEKW